MSLLTKAKVITTPTAYSDGFLHSVKPSVVLGDELVVNGTFDTDSDWTKVGNTTISGGKANAVNNANGFFIIQTSTLDVNKTYKLTFDLTDYTSGTLQFVTSTGDISFSNDIGSKELIYKPPSTNILFKCANGPATFSIDNVSVKEAIDADFTFTRNSSATRVGEDGYIQDVQIIGGELVQNGDFEEIGSNVIVQGGWVDVDGAAEFYDNKIKINAGVNISTNRIRQVGVIDSGKTYKYTYEVLENNGVTNFRYYNGSTYVSAPNTVGIHTIYYTHTGSNLDFFIRVSDTTLGNYMVLRDNVSVKEVGQNWTVSNSDSTHYVEFSEDGARFVSDTTSPILTLGQGISLTSGNKYRFSIRLRNNGGTGNIKVQATGLEFMPNILDGTYTQDIIPTTNQSAVSFYRNGSDVDLYIEDFSIKEVTDDTNLPRINYEGFSYDNGLPIYGSGKGHLLLEGQSTNLISYSEDFTQWSKSGLLDDAILVNQISPSGESQCGFLNTTDTTSGAKFNYIAYSTTSDIHTQSVFIKYHSKQWFQFAGGATSYYANFDVLNGVVGNVSGCTAKIEDYGNGWYRCSLTTTSAVLPINYAIVFLDDDTASRLPSTTGVGSYYVWGGQMETDNLSSYIPTNGSAVTRAAETCNNAGNADLFDSEGVLYAEIAALANDGTYREIALSDGTSVNRIELRYTPSSNLFQYVVRDSNVVQMVYNQSLDDATEFNKFALRYKDNDFSAWINGVQVHTDTSGNAPTGLSELAFDDGAGSVPFRGKTKMVGVFPYLSNDEMECLTGEGYGSFEAMALANNYTII